MNITWERRQAAKARRVALKERAIEYKGGSCLICKYKWCASAMEFHHVNSFEKDFSISERMTSWERIVKELDQCVLLCCRCHREVHDGLHPQLLGLDEFAGLVEDLEYALGEEEECEF